MSSGEQNTSNPHDGNIEAIFFSTWFTMGWPVGNDYPCIQPLLFNREILELMKKEKKIPAVAQKIKDVIKSCKTYKQLELSLDMVTRFSKLYPGQHDLVDKMIDWVGNQRVAIKAGLL